MGCDNPNRPEAHMPDPAMMVLASGNGHGHHIRIVIGVLVVILIAAIVVGWMYYVRASRARGSGGEKP
jgi:Tfp pilus assembly protein PilN